MPPTIFFDAVGDPLSSSIFNNLPPQSILITYGNLAKEKSININLK